VLTPSEGVVAHVEGWILGVVRNQSERLSAIPRIRIGYANRPTTGNWRYGDLHPARLAPCRLLLSPVPADEVPSTCICVSGPEAHGFPPFGMGAGRDALGPEVARLRPRRRTFEIVRVISRGLLSI
jgi:hypothetical protein